MKFACYLILPVLLVSACSKTTPVPQALPAPNAALQCHKDTDCKGDRICNEGMCAEPAVAAGLAGSNANDVVAAKAAEAGAEVPAAQSMNLDDVFGDLANGCSDDGVASGRIVDGYMGKAQSYPPKLARPEGDRKFSPHLGKATFEINAEEGYTGLTVPAKDATLYGMPVTRLYWYQGMENGINGVEITFSVPIDQVKRNLSAAKIKLRSVENEVGEWGPILEASRESPLHTVFKCDTST